MNGIDISADTMIFTTLTITNAYIAFVYVPVRLIHLIRGEQIKFELE
jgi:hypothetical protein